MNLFDAMEQATQARLAARRAADKHGLYASYQYRQPDGTYQAVAECDCTIFYTTYGPRLIADANATGQLNQHIEIMRENTPEGVLV